VGIPVISGPSPERVGVGDDVDVEPDEVELMMVYT